ncbi:hypothetical protein [Pseudomonas sp. VS38]|uniref:hypothetical protein n=1 Tax=Pseudomonas sp. VS38 TaxID=2834066 RepID=UPI001BDEAE27|nr:hypothetical protein [Pseudomonas sp. VS38]MBT1266423.1 hypothetical protein [Pseudomonas sp. VS38]
MTDSGIHAMRLSKLAADEADCQRLQIPHRFMQMSALSPSTRDSHAARSGELFTADEVREWLAKDDNSVGCKCSFVLVLVDDAGNPRSPDLVQKLISAKDNFFARRNQSP